MVSAATPRVAVGQRTANLRVSDWLFRSKYASAIWLLARIWLGYQWLNAGYQKIWGSEKMFFWYGNGAGVYGFAKGGVAANAGPMGAVGYGWWAAFLHNFVMPNASWIAKLITLGEIAIGIRPHPRPVHWPCGISGSGSQLHLHDDRERRRQPALRADWASARACLEERRSVWP